MYPNQGTHTGQKRKESAGQGSSPHAFARELAMLSGVRDRKRPIDDVIWAICGADSAGRAAALSWLGHLRGLPTLESRCADVEQFLRLFARPRRHGSQWRATGSESFAGRQHTLISQEAADRAFEAGEHPSRDRRRYLPKKSAGGIAARCHSSRDKRAGVSVSTCHRRRASLRRGGIIASAQPPWNASDAVLPKTGGKWPYAQHWLLLPPTPEMLRRWVSAAQARRRRDVEHAARRRQQRAHAARTAREPLLSAEELEALEREIAY